MENTQRIVVAFIIGEIQNLVKVFTALDGGIEKGIELFAGEGCKLCP